MRQIPRLRVDEFHGDPAPRLLVFLNRCHACDAANPHGQGQPRPERCSSCGSEIAAAWKWEGAWDRIRVGGKV